MLDTRYSMLATASPPFTQSFTPSLWMLDARYWMSAWVDGWMRCLRFSSLPSTHALDFPRPLAMMLARKEGPPMAELIWDGKYDAQGRKTAPLRVALPFQTVETVNESREVRLQGLLRFDTGGDPEWRNRLIWGDKRYVLPSLLPELAGKVDLIYIDPPFATGADFSFTASLPDLPETDEDESASFTKEPSIIEQKAYRDTWGRGLESYVQWFYETVVLLHELLAGNGSLFVHCDWRITHEEAGSHLHLSFGPICFRGCDPVSPSDGTKDWRLARQRTPRHE